MDPEVDDTMDIVRAVKKDRAIKKRKAAYESQMKWMKEYAYYHSGIAAERLVTVKPTPAPAIDLHPKRSYLRKMENDDFDAILAVKKEREEKKHLAKLGAAYPEIFAFFESYMQYLENASENSEISEYFSTFVLCKNPPLFRLIQKQTKLMPTKL